MDYTKIREETKNIVRQASKIMTARSFEVIDKSTPSNIVTSADIGVQHYLQTELRKLLPESGFYCEEEDVMDLGCESVWVIDPIDGTTNYARGIGECAISVALVCRGKAVIGVVYNPYMDHMFEAELGKGAWLNGEAIHVSDMPFERSLLCTAMSVYKKEYTKMCLDVIAEAYEQCNDIRRIGTCAVELCYVAAGKCDLYFELRLFPWDFAAASLILREAGGVARGLHGEELRFDRVTPVIGANSEENFARLSAIVSKHVASIPYED